MCIAQIIAAMFKPKPVIPTPDPPAPVLTIPHPEEPEDKTKTMANTNPQEAEMLWREGWNVPAEFKTDIVFTLTDSYASYGIVGYDWAPAITVGNNVYYHPSYSNGGICAHEVCHPVWATLTPQQQTDFETDYNSLINTDAYMILLYDYKIKNADPNWIGNPWEKHAEIYRYLGDKMPEALKVFYPNLLV